MTDHAEFTARLNDFASFAAKVLNSMHSELVALEAENKALRAGMEAICGVGFDAPATFAGTDAEWERRRANKMQSLARIALTPLAPDA